MEAETYEWTIKCPNCFKQSTVNIPKGTTVDDYRRKGIVCANCGVRHTQGVGSK